MPCKPRGGRILPQAGLTHKRYALRLPVFAAPLFLVSSPELVIAACKAGIIGSFPTANARPIKVLEEWMIAITQGLEAARAENPDAVIGPWCANVVVHKSNTRLEQDLALIAKYQPPIVVTALGHPRATIDVVHGYGGQVFVDVSTVPMARKAAEAGADGLACICAGAGGHTGSLSPFAFASAVREFFDGPLVISGAISTGAAIAGAIAAGADYVYIGSSFIPTTESMAAPDYKQMIVDCGLEDLVSSAVVTGTNAIWLRPSLEAAGVNLDDLPAVPDRNYDSNRDLGARRWVDTWAAGQGIDAIGAIEPVAVVVDRLEREYRAAVKRFASINA
jgi:nitronate monooxygenase